MSHIVKLMISIALLSMNVVMARAAPVSLNLTNRTGSAITSMTVAEKTAPDVVIPFVFAGELSVRETDTATINLADGVCLVDITYTLASGRKIVEENIDVCNVDGVIVE